MADKIATIKGVFLAPGRSLNGNLYTPANIADAVTRMKASIATGSGPPVSQLPEHWTDNVLLTVGQVTDCGQNPDGSAWYEAAVPNTSAGRDLATLTNTENGPAYVRCVSIAAFWEGDIEEIEIDGEWSVTAPGLNVRRIDYVPDPGVVQAHISSSVFGEAAAGTWRDAFEGVEMTVTKAPRKTGFRPAHADPGFLADGKPRLPLTTTREIREAWRTLNHEGHGYAPGDLARARARVKQAAKDLDVPLDAAPSGGNPAAVRSIEDVKGQLGTLTTEVRAGLTPLDPDQDGDIDGYGCPTCGSILPETDPALNPDGDSMESKEPEMTETAKPAEAAKPATTETAAATAPVSLSEADLARLAEMLRAKDGDKPAATETVTPPATEGSTSQPTPITVDALMERLNQTLDERDKQIAQDLIEAFGPPRRRGLVSGGGTEGTPLHKLTPEEWRARKTRMAEAFLPTPVLTE